MLKCSSCDKPLFVGGIKYHTPDNLHVFCDAYCSNDWYSKTFEKLDAKKDQTENNDE
jgi:hypothetical protein